ncbi:MAG: hypothetical protein R3F11_17415 [Verrucomicrobiales bacterium]
MKPTKSLLILTAALGVAMTAGVAQADDRRFAYNYEVTTMPQGAWEFENWMTWSHYGSKERFDFRHEIEYGLTNDLQIALYLADWRYEDLDGGGSDADYRNTAIEVIYNLTDPVNDAIGSALYGEVKLGDEKFALEGKLLLQKDFGPLSVVYNFTLESEWEGEDLSSLDEKKGEIKNSAGVSYQLSPQFFVGAEILHEFEIEDWSERGDDSLFIGPNASFRKGSFFLTAAALFEVLDTEGAAESQLRILAGINF